MESDQLSRAPRGHSVEMRMLGPLTIRRDDVAVTLPASRKVRALLAYLALAPHAVARSELCELLWDGPNDPRGELRWCLSKIRSLVEEPRRHRVVTEADTVSLDLAECFVDATEVARAVQSIETIALDQLRSLETSFAGDFLGGLDIDGSPAFTGWLGSQRRRFRGCHAALLEQLVSCVPDEEALGYLEKWLALAPFDQNVHELLFNVLARRGQIREAEEHLAATIRLFEAEDLDATPVRDAWRSARSHDVSVASSSIDAGSVVAPARRGSVAVMPFVDWSTVTGARGGTADALAHDVITRLAKLRSLFVIAQGTVFALQERRVGPEEAARMLNVDYVVSGSVQRRGDRLTVMAELAETRTARIIWAETFNHDADDTLHVLDEIGNSIVASIANEIETSERNRAVLRPPNSRAAANSLHRTQPSYRVDDFLHAMQFAADGERLFRDAAKRIDATARPGRGGRFDFRIC